MGCIYIKDHYSMKYPPVVTTLQEWLDGKLGSQGIDAVSCAFYVLSLLQGDPTDEPEAFYHFPSSKVVDEQGIPCWPRDSGSGWGGFRCADTSDTSVAAKTIPEPVQGYEIELLGNGLSPHLKSIPSEEGSTRNIEPGLCDKQSYSLPAGNQIEKCYKALLVGGRPSDGAKCSVGSVTESSSTLRANESACVGFLKHKLEGGGLGEGTNPLMAEAMMKHRKGKDQRMADAKETGNRKPMFVHDENLLWHANGPGLPWNAADENASPNLMNVMKQGKRGPGTQELWETDTYFKQFKGSVAAGMPCVESEGVENLSEVNEDDRSLAQLVAKFDHSIAAIWNLSNSRPVQYEDRQELSWNFHSLVSPSQDDALKMELNGFGNSEPFPEENSFIHCGTNITNSIWSEQPFLSHPSNEEGSDLKYVGDCVNEDHSELCCKLKVLLATDGLLQNEFNLFEWNPETSDGLKKESHDAGGNFMQKVPGDCSGALWNKIQTFPSLFSDISFQEQFFHLENFQDVDCANSQKQNSCMISCSPCSASHLGDSSLMQLQNNAAANAKRNFHTLNHNSEDSSFTEVIPRRTVGRNLTHDRYFSQMKHSVDVANQFSEECKNNYESSLKKEEEEDLLTSKRTHFQPIHQEPLDPQYPGSRYADGTTFIVSSSFVDVPFKRSESGTLFLDGDDVTDAPKVYMEYKEKKVGDHRGSRCSFPKETSDSRGAFIPKFCVRQIEKCCQTEESGDVTEELNSKRIKHNEIENKNNLYFSDEEIIKSVADYLDDDSGKFTSEEADCKDNHHDEAMEDTLSQNLRNEAVSKNLEAETYIWNKTGCTCNNNYLFSSKSDSLGMFGASVLGEKDGLWPLDSARSCQSQFSIWSCSPGPPPTEPPCAVCREAPASQPLLREELREELSEDGEQLLSDLSSLQRLQLSAPWPDDASAELLARVSCTAPSTSLRAK